MAYTNSNRLESDRQIGNTKTSRKQFRGRRTKSSSISLLTPYEHENACKCVRDADVVAYRVDRLKAIGNGQVPAVAATAWKLLSERI
jgi:DNA (cytosine-5)-methyltransferase 1